MMRRISVSEHFLSAVLATVLIASALAYSTSYSDICDPSIDYGCEEKGGQCIEHYEPCPGSLTAMYCPDRQKCCNPHDGTPPPPPPSPGPMPTPAPTSIPQPGPSPSPTPTPTPTTQPEPSPTSTPTPQPEPSPAPTPTPTTQPEPSPTPTPTPQPEPTPAPTTQPEPSPAPTPTQTPQPGPSPTPTPTPTPAPTTQPEPSPAPTTQPEPSPAPTQQPEPSPTPTPSCTCPDTIIWKCFDLSSDHPDMQFRITGFDPDIVLPNLDNQTGLPVYNSAANNPSTTNATNFAHWYDDASCVNEGPVYIETDTRGECSVDEPDFFPLDGQLLGNEGRPHNYHFTCYTRLNLYGTGSSCITLGSDDDSWAFLDGSLVIDNGGVHSYLTDDYCFTKTNPQPQSLALFFAERHTTRSRLSFDSGDFCVENIFSLPYPPDEIVDPCGNTTTCQGFCSLDTPTTRISLDIVSDFLIPAAIALFATGTYVSWDQYGGL